MPRAPLAPSPPSSAPSPLPSIGWDADWRTPLPLDDLEWPIGTPRQAAQRWMREGLPTDPVQALPSPEAPGRATVHDPKVCVVRVTPTRVDQAGRRDRLTHGTLYRAELAARWAPAPRFFQWFDAGTQALPVQDQQRLLMRCLLGAFDTDHRPVFEGLWTRWMDRVATDRIGWSDFLRTQNDRRPSPPTRRLRQSSALGSGRSPQARGYDRHPYGQLLIEDPWGEPMRVEERFRSSHPWHLPFVERALTQTSTTGGALVQHWAHTGTCPISAWNAAPMGPYRELPPVAAMRSGLRPWVWEELARDPVYVHRHGDDLLEDWLLRMIRDAAHSGAPGDATLWQRLLTPWIEAGARLPHTRNPNRDELHDRLPNVFEAPGARTWDPAVQNRQNNVPSSARTVWTLLTPIEQHLDEVAALRAAIDAVAPEPEATRPRSRL